MKALALLALVALAPQKGFSFERKYVVGESDAYTLTTKMEGGMAMTMTMDTTQTVVKVYDNGDADVESKLANGRVKVGGFDQKIPGGPPAVVRLSKYGALVSTEATKGRPRMGMDFSKYTNRLPKDGVKVGQTLVIDETDASDPKMALHVKGTTTLESIEAGVAKFVSALDVTADKSPQPMHLDVTTFVETTNAKLKRAEVKATNPIGMPAGMKASTVTMTMERKA